MLSPEYLRDLPEAILALFGKVELRILADMARRLKKYNYWLPSVEHQNERLRIAGIVQEDVLKALSELSGKSELELRQLMQTAAKKTLKSDTAVYEAAGKTVPKVAESEHLRELLNAGYQATAQTMRNVCRTTARTAAKQFTDALDLAWLQVQSGAFDLNTAVRTAIEDLAEQGIQAVRYPSGRADTLEVAVRRAVVTGVNQTSLKMQLALAKDVGCDLVQASAHAGARPSHAVWQGRVFSISGKHPKYPSLVDGTGYGTGEGLGGWNCFHGISSYVEGAPTVWTEEELQKLNEPKYEYNGKMLTEYEAQQKQRYHERQIRRWKREEAALNAAGLDSTAASAKVKQWQSTQAAFLKQTGLQRQYERENIVDFGKGIAKPSESGIIQAIIDRDEASDVQTVGKIDIQKYSCITPHIRTDEVIITDERVVHIQERHPNDYERYCSYIPRIIAEPDYIIEANKPNTGVLLKDFSENDEKFKLILRLKVEADPEEYKNSVMSFWKIGDTTWEKTIKNKKVLYKKE